MNRSFIMLLVLVIFLGAGFGGSFVGGVIYGEIRAENAAEELSPRLGTVGQSGGVEQGTGGGQRGQGRQGQGGGLAGDRGRDGPPADRQTDGSVSPFEGQEAGQRPENDQDSSRQRGGASQRDRDSGPAFEAREGPDGPAAGAGEAETRQTGIAERGQPNALPGGATGRGGVLGTVTSLGDQALILASPRGERAVTLSETTIIYQVSETTPEALIENVTVRVNGSRGSEGALEAEAVIILPDGAENLFGVGGGPGGRQRSGGP